MYLTGPVNDQAATAVGAQLLVLEAQDPHADITLYVNSPGGASVRACVRRVCAPNARARRVRSLWGQRHGCEARGALMGEERCGGAVLAAVSLSLIHI